jgi:pSer/pThr/pTyr-binding forkhead associated (FHA) protein
MTLSLPQAFGLACKAAGPIRIHAVHRATGRKQDFTVNSPFAIIGRSAAAHVRLDDSSISQGHAYLQVIEGVPFCIDLGSRTGVVWEDGTQSQGWVMPENTLQVGVFDLRVERPGNSRPESQHDINLAEDPDSPILAQAAVEIHPASSGARTAQPLDRAITLVGRHPSCDLRLLDSAIGYFHCALVNTSDGVWLVDLLTRKGAILNGRTTRLSRVHDGDLIELGKISLVLRIGAHHSSQLAMPKQELVPNGQDPMALISTAVAESVAGAFAPVGEMMKQFQQCYMAMAQMFASMQQEHALLVNEQMRQIQELVDELRDLRSGSSDKDGLSDATEPIGNPPVSKEPRPAAKVAAEPPVPTMKSPKGQEGQALSGAHAWFMERLTKQGPSPPAGS